MKTRLLLSLIALVFASQLKAQTLISGRVRSQNGSPLSNANISLKDSYDGTSSDSTGHFQFSTTEKGKWILQFSSLNYYSDSLIIDLAGTPLVLDVKLKEKANELNTVVISAGTFEASDSKKGVVLSSLDVATTAGATADIFAALQTLPGTQTAFSESGLFVRGGSAAETKTFFDGMLVKNPFNSRVPDQASRGRFSPFLFKGTSFSSGGYSAQYGQALSSALVLESKDLPEKTTTGISLLSVGAGLDQNIRFKNSALSLGGFYYNLKPAFSVIKQNTDWDKEPEQYGATIQYKARTSNTGMFKWYSDFSNSDLGMYQPDAANVNTRTYFSNQNRNTYINTSWQDFIGSNWKLMAGASYSNSRDEGLQAIDEYGRQDKLLQGRVTATRYLGSLSSIRFGSEVYAFEREESWNKQSRSYRDNLNSLFAETDWFFTNTLMARVGVRSEYSSYLEKFNIAPRLSMGYKAGKYSQFAMAYGTFYQNPEDEYLILQPLDYEKAEHYILNYQRNTSNYTLRGEFYRKNYSALVKDNQGLLSNTGDGYAQGFDLFWRDKKSFKGVDYWVSYSYLDTKRNFADYPAAAVPPFAAKHTLNLVYKKFFEKLKSQIGTTYTFATGRSYYNPNNPGFMADKTKCFNNFSANISYLTHVFGQFTVLYISANNIPGFKNVYGYNYSPDGSFRQAVRPAANRDLFVGLLITVGDNTFVR